LGTSAIVRVPVNFHGTGAKNTATRSSFCRDEFGNHELGPIVMSKKNGP
jgi:hypothetical protein